MDAKRRWGASATIATFLGLMVFLAGCSGTSSDEQGGEETGEYTWIEGSPFAPASFVGRQCSGTAFESSGEQNFNLSPVQVTGTLTLNGEQFPEDAGFNGFVGVLIFESTSGETRTPAPLTRETEKTFQAELPAGTYDIRFEPTDNDCESGPLPCAGGVLQESVQIREEEQLQLNVATAQLSGVVTVNDARMPDASVSRGRLRLESPDGSEVEVSVGRSGVADYAVNVMRGSYDVEWVPGGDACFEQLVGKVPCAETRLEEGLRINQDMTESFNMSVATIQGSVTFDGEQPPGGLISSVGRLVFESSNGELGVTTSLMPNDTSYAVTLPKGSYNIHYAPGEVCAGDTSPGVPCVSGRIASDIDVRSETDLDVNVPTVRVSGSVSPESGDVPQANESWGAIGFVTSEPTVPADSHAAAIGGFVRSEDRRYEIDLMPGSYDAAWFAREDAEDCIEAENIPCNTGPIAEDLSIQSDESIDIELPSAHVTGELTLDGGTLPPAMAARGRLELVNSSGIVQPTESLGRQGPGTFEITLLPGDYDIIWRPTENLCQLPSSGQLPCNAGIIEEELSILSSGELTVDMSTVELSGLVTVNDSSPPDIGINRGSLFFRNDVSRYMAGDLGASGTAPYDATLLADEYVVVFDGNEEICGEPEVMPCGLQVLDGC